ncbi:putative transposase [Vigna unguiculata]|nr:putative transposase [Vigna unguiculata]
MMKNIDGREPSRAEMFIMTHKPKNEETKKIILKLEDAISSHSIEPEKNSTRDDVFSQVFGKDRHGYVRTYGKGVSPSDLWGSNSRVGIQKLIDEVQRNAQVELQSMKNRMQEEMEIKLKEQVKEQVETKLKEQLEAMKVELLNNFKIAFTQIPSYAPEVMVSNLNKEEVDIEDDPTLKMMDNDDNISHKGLFIS